MNSVKSDQVLKAGVIGHPISHSKSPLIHNYWLQKYGIAGNYQAYNIPCESLRDEVFKLRNQGLKGFNVTIPHKLAIMECCTTLTQEAQQIGAVNTVVFHRNGEIEGRNTDAYGFIENLKASTDFKFKESSAVILGAGGAARAAIYALKKEGVTDICISNRTIDKAEELAEEFSLRVYDWQDETAFKDAGLLVNTTSLGMKGQPELQIDLKNLPPQAIVYDIVYAPLITPLLQQAQDRNLKTVTGIGMLLHQARAGFQAWFGVLPGVDKELERLALK